MKRRVNPSVSFHDDLIRRLKDTDYAAGYLSACLEEDEETFLLGLRHVAEAQGGLRRLAKRSHLNREHLFRMLSKSGNPHLHSLRQLVGAVGLKFSFLPA